MMLWLGIPTMAYVITWLVMMGQQSSDCSGGVHAGKAAIGAIPTAAAVLLALGLSHVAFCRIPIASVFAPMFVDTKVNVLLQAPPTAKNTAKNAACCSPMMSLEAIEKKFPMVSGVSYGFYVFFATMFGMVFGMGSVC